MTPRSPSASTVGVSLKDHIGLADQLPKAFDFLVERKAEQDDHDDHDDWINATSDWG